MWKKIKKEIFWKEDGMRRREKRKEKEKNPLHSDVDAQSQQNYSQSLVSSLNTRQSALIISL